MAREVEYGGKVHEFPDDATDDEIRSALEGAQPAAPPQVNLTQAPIDVLRGVAKGAGSTLAHTLDIVPRMAGTPRVLDRPEVQSMITPTNPWENIGYGAEQMGEFMVPGGLVRRGAQAVEAATAGARGSTLLNLATRSGLEGMASGGVAGLQTSGDQKAMEQAALIGAGVTAALGAASSAIPAAGRGFEKWAENQYGKVLNPTMRGTKYLSRTETIPGMLERRVTSGLGGMEGLLSKTQSKVNEWGKAVENAWSSIPQDTPMALAPMIQHLDDWVAPARVGNVPLGPAADVRIRNADQMKEMLTKLAKPNPQTGALEITVGDLRKAKQFAGEIAADAGAYEGKTIDEKSLTKAYEMVEEAARHQINPKFPQVEQANQQFHFWKNADKVVDETVQRRVGQDRGLIRSIVTAGLGGTAGNAIAGPAGMIAGPVTLDLLQRAVTSPAWRTLSAVTKQRLAEALTSGNTGAIEFYLRQILKGGAGAKITIPTSKELPAPRLAPTRSPQE